MNKPNKLKIKNQPYKLVVFRVISRYEDGTPENLMLVKDTGTVELSENPQENNFVTAYMPDTDYRQYAGEIPTL